MAKGDGTDEIFSRIDTNRDGNIDKDEFRKYTSRSERFGSSPYQSSSSAHHRYGNGHGRFDRYPRRFASQYDLDSMVNKYSYGTTTGTSSDAVIHTNSSEETHRYLERSAHNIYVDPNPQIIRRSHTDGPIRAEQRVTIRYLQPPPLPPPEPIIIKEVRPEQPPPPPPLIIREHPPASPSPPPLILRERPPTPPARIPGETITRCLSPLPVPPRSVVVERFQSAPEKPRDIIIERWLPYGPPPERRKIVQSAPPPARYSEPSHTIVVYDSVQTHVVRKLERLGVTEENPDAYVARYGSSLLNSASLVQQARDAGVIEDISPSLSSSSAIPSRRDDIVNFDRPGRITNDGFLSSCENNYERVRRFNTKEAVNVGYTANIGSSCEGPSECESSFSITNTRANEQSNQASHQYI